MSRHIMKLEEAGGGSRYKCCRLGAGEDGVVAAVVVVVLMRDVVIVDGW